MTRMSDEEQMDGEPTVFNEADPLAILKGESKKGNAALHDYYLMGKGRSLEKLLKSYQNATNEPPTRRIKSLKDWSRFFAWQERIAAQTRLDDAARRAKWEERQEEIREADYQQAGQLRKLVDDALKEAPAFLRQRRRIVKGENGQPDQIIVTLAIDAKMIISGAKVASDLQRRAAGLEDETIKHTGEVSAVPITMADWRKRSARRRAQVEKDLSDFNGEAGGPNE